MIYEKITVHYYSNNNREVALDYEDFEDKNADVFDRFCEFTKFKNNGEVSKTEASQYSFVNKEAERLLAERLKVKAQTKEDEKRAIELAQIVNKAFEGRDDLGNIEIDIEEDGHFYDGMTPGWVTIKTKWSHSKWYRRHDENWKTAYHTQVPIEVEKEARELQAIRRKHQGDDSFDFFETWYRRRTVREADHPNYDFWG